MQLSSALNRRAVRYLLAAASGIALALSFPQASLWPLAPFALAPLIAVAVRAENWREAFLLGEVALTITWLINVPWVVHVMAFYGGLGAPTGIALFVALAIVLGMYGGLFTVAVWLIRADDRFVTWLPVPFIWAASEYARSHLLTGFPWNLLGGAFIDLPAVAILSSLAGPYFVGGLAVFVSTVVAWQLAANAAAKTRTSVAAISVTIVIVAVLAGAWTLSEREKTITPPSDRAALLQPNITQEMRWDTQLLFDIFARMAAMTDRAAESGVKTIVWPESTIPLTYVRTPFFRDYIESVSRNSQVDIILGSVAEDETDEAKIWNAAYLVSNGETKGRYDKIHLVPFGEYVPLRKVIFFAEKLVRQVGEFQFGTNDHPLAGRHNYGPAICYEVVFPRIAAKQISNGADVLVTITNDAWFGDSAAPRQHLQMARMRAVEGDRYLLRSATTGISAVVDPAGRIVQSLPLGRQGMLIAAFSPRQSITPYVRFGDWFAILAVVLTAAAIYFGRRRVHG